MELLLRILDLKPNKKKIVKIKLNIAKNKMTFSKGKGSFSLHRQTTREDLNRYFKMAGLTNIISSFNSTDFGWEFFNKEGKRAYCTHEDLIKKLEELEEGL